MYGESESGVAGGQAASLTHTFYKGEGHGMSGVAAQEDRLLRISNFLQINLKPWDFTSNPPTQQAPY